MLARRCVDMAGGQRVHTQQHEVLLSASSYPYQLTVIVKQNVRLPNAELVVRQDKMSQRKNTGLVGTEQNVTNFSLRIKSL